MKFSKLPEELEPEEEDYVYYDKHHDLPVENVDEYFSMAWEDYIEFQVKENYAEYKSEVQDERNEEKESGELVPPFKDWHEAIYDYILNLENYIEHNKEEIFSEFKSYHKDICEPSDFFEDE